MYSTMRRVKKKERGEIDLFDVIIILLILGVCGLGPCRGIWKTDEPPAKIECQDKTDCQH